MADLVERTRARAPIPGPMGRAIRKRAGITQAELAAELGVEQVSVSRYEREVSHPRGLVAERYYRLLRELQDQA